ncbi:MerR family DNA-binding protein [Xenorhabdus santafensis]|uniref:MerR family DNA-binding protein n=1 Tax=Xenorhabdus santafensis TaxID=2582833 RepID=UPI0029E7F019|nr:MerR family DNA-binding protein [Xenorhabdus sp. 12]
MKVAQSAGIPLKEIQETLCQFPPNSNLTVKQWQVISSQWRDTLNKCINMLTKLCNHLNSRIGCGCLSLTDCLLRNPHDISGEKVTVEIILKGI